MNQFPMAQPQAYTYAEATNYSLQQPTGVMQKPIPTPSPPMDYMEIMRQIQEKLLAIESRQQNQAELISGFLHQQPQQQAPLQQPQQQAPLQQIQQQAPLQQQPYYPLGNLPNNQPVQYQQLNQVQGQISMQQ